MKKLIGIIFSLFIIPGFLFAQAAFSVIPIAKDSTINEHSPYLTSYWYDGLLNEGWYNDIENFHPIWLTYIESSSENYQKIIAQNIWFDWNHNIFISSKFLVSDTTNHIQRRSPLIENYYFRPVSIWIEGDSNNCYLYYSIFGDSKWSTPQKITNEPSTVSLPVFFTNDATNFSNQNDFFNRLFWISDNSIYEAQLDSIFFWQNYKNLYYSESSKNSLSARMDRNSNLWLLFDENLSKDSVAVKTFILPKDSLNWKGPFTLLKLHEPTSQASLNLLDFSINQELVLNWIDKDCMYDTLVFYKNDSLHYESGSYFYNFHNFTNFEYVSNSLLMGGCIFGFAPYFFISYLNQSFTELHIRSPSYNLEPFYTTQNNVEKLTISGFNKQYYVLCWSEYDGRQTDIYLYVDFIVVGDVEGQNLFQPSSLGLYQNYPNPFNSETKIIYFIPKSGFVTLKIYNLSGKEITTLVNKINTPGKYELIFDAGNLSSGLYLYQLQSQDFIQTKKLLLVR